MKRKREEEGRDNAVEGGMNEEGRVYIGTEIVLWR